MKLFKKLGAGLLSLAMVIGLMSGISFTAMADDNPYAPTEFVEHNGVKFGRATEAYQSTGRGGTVNYKGFPLFDGQEEHFDEYLDLLMSELTIAGKVALNAGGNGTGSYVKDGETITYNIPAGNSVGGEALQGAASQTALSTVMYQAQSWNIDLINTIGNLMGRENKSKQTNDGFNWTSVTGTSMTDMRLNPLSGRYDEGYGEDPAMASMFAAANSNGYNGYGVGDDNFYILGSVNTKHYTAYGAQWFRHIASTQVGARSFYEYNSKSANKGFREGLISSFMSSYGRINNVPSSSTFMMSWANHVSKYDIYNGPDAMADYPYMPYEVSGNENGQYSNGYDLAYMPNEEYKIASMVIAGHRGSGGVAALQAALENGYNGITDESLNVLASAYLTIRTRVGIYDEKDANGLSKYYPFNDIASNTENKVDYTSASSQDIALQNAEEGIVLLKNDNNALPLATTDKVGVYGVFAQALNSGLYQVPVADWTGHGDEAGATGFEAISKRVADASYNKGLNVVTIQTKDGGYWFVDGTTIAIKSAEDFAAAENKDNYYFGILDSGQAASSIYSYGADRWVRCATADPTTGLNAFAGWTNPLFPNPQDWKNPSFVAVDENPTFKNIPGAMLPPVLSGYPYHLMLEKAEADGEYYIHAGGKVNGVSFINVSPLMETNYGFYFEVQKNDEGKEYINLGGAYTGARSDQSIGVNYFKNAADKSAMTFKVTEVQPYGYEAEANIAEDDTAIIYVGQTYLGLSGEGTDRSSLEMGAGQVESALNIAKEYKAAGKKTVVVIYANYPVVAEELQNSADVDAILFAGYGGTFGAKATAEVLTGEVTPTGRLVSTWYKDMDLFPAISEYSLPQGSDRMDGEIITGEDGTRTVVPRFLEDGMSLDEISDIYKVDMYAADVIDTGVTYKYLTDEEAAEHVTYPFGYGLSYTNFKWSDFNVVPDGDMYKATIKVENTGDVDSSDVVEIYAAKKDGSAYGDAIEKKSLVGFAKVALEAGESKTVEITIDPEYLQIWDVNAEDFIVESGSYEFSAAKDSSLEGALTTTLTIEGKDIAKAPAKELNIWEHAFDQENVYYSEYSKLQTAKAAVEEEVGDDIYAVEAKAPGAWVAIPKVDLTDVTTAELKAGAPEGVNGTIDVKVDGPNGATIATFDVKATGEVTLELASTSYEKTTIKEQGYDTIEAEVAATSGLHDIYLVYNAKGLRAATVDFLTTEGKIEKIKEELAEAQAAVEAAKAERDAAAADADKATKEANEAAVKKAEAEAALKEAELALAEAEAAKNAAETKAAEAEVKAAEAEKKAAEAEAAAAAAKVKAPAKAAVAKLTAKKKALTIKWKKVAGANGYEIQIATNKKFTKNLQTITVKKGTTVSKTIKKLKAKSKYFVRVRAYKTVGGGQLFGKWSAAKNKKTK